MKYSHDAHIPHFVYVCSANFSGYCHREIGNAPSHWRFKNAANATTLDISIFHLQKIFFLPFCIHFLFFVFEN